MSHNINVKFDSRKNGPFGRYPTPEQLSAVITDYIGFGGTVTQLEDNWWFINLGKRSGRSVAAGLVDPETKPHLYAVLNRPESERGITFPNERFFEVWDNKDSSTVSIVTRMADEFTMAVARGLAAAIGRLWDGKVKEDS